MARIENSYGLEKWLQNQTKNVGSAIAARVALRVIPLFQLSKKDRYRSDFYDADRIIFMIRTNASAWIASRYYMYVPQLGSLSDMADFSSSEAQYLGASGRNAWRYDPDSASRTAAAVSSAAAYAAYAADAAAAGAATTSAYAADAAASAASAAAGRSTASGAPDAVAIWDSVSADIGWLEQDKKRNATKLLDRPLWNDRRFQIDTPIWVVPSWQNLSKTLLAERQNWAVWTDWYDARLKGGGRHSDLDREIDLFRVTLSDEAARSAPGDRIVGEWRQVLAPFEAEWKKGPKHVNKLIADWIKARKAEESAKRRERKAAEAANEAVARIPPQRPARLEPEVRGGRLVQPTKPLAADLEPAELLAALQAWRDDANELASDVAALPPQYDRRPAQALARIAARITGAEPSRTDLHRLFNATDVISAMAASVAEEWPTDQAAHYAALRLQLDRILWQYPHFRAMRANAAPEPATIEQAEAAVAVGRAMANVLSDAEVAEAIDPVIPETLNEEAAEIQQHLDVRAQAADPPPFSRHRTLSDLLESVSNTLKALFADALKAAGKRAIATTGAMLAITRSVLSALAPFGKKYINGLKNGSAGELEKTGESHAKQFWKATRAFPTAAALWWLLSWFPTFFAWLDGPLIKSIIKAAFG